MSQDCRQVADSRWYMLHVHAWYCLTTIWKRHFGGWQSHTQECQGLAAMSCTCRLLKHSGLLLCLGLLQMTWQAATARLASHHYALVPVAATTPYSWFNLASMLEANLP